MEAKHTPEVRRVDMEFSRVWMKEHPALFVESVLDFLDSHPAEQWERSVRTYNWFVTLSAIAKATGSAS